MPVIRIKQEDKERIDHMRGLVSTTKFMTVILDRAEQPLQKGNPDLKKKKVHPQFGELRKIFEEAWTKRNGFAYRWSGAADASALNRLIKTLESLAGESTITDLFTIIMDRLPVFYHDKTINAINKNINGIIADIKSGGNKTSKVQNGGEYDFRN